MKQVNFLVLVLLCACSPGAKMAHIQQAQELTREAEKKIVTIDAAKRKAEGEAQSKQRAIESLERQSFTLAAELRRATALGDRYRALSAQRLDLLQETAVTVKKLKAGVPESVVVYRLPIGAVGVEAARLMRDLSHQQGGQLATAIRELEYWKTLTGNMEREAAQIQAEQATVSPLENFGPLLFAGLIIIVFTACYVVAWNLGKRE